MLAAKKRKIDDEGRVIKSEWCTKYFVVAHNQGDVCLVCRSTIAVINEYNVKLITQAITSPSLIKLLVKHEWTKSNI